MRIEDGTGRGYEAKVDDDNLLYTFGHNVSFEHHVNHIEHDSYSAVFDVTPSGAGNVFFYLKNTSDDDLIITSIKLFTDSTEDIEVCLSGTGTPVSGTDLTPVNRTSGTANTADCDCQTGTDITGISGSNLVDRIVLSNVNKTEKYTWGSALVILKNTTVTLQVAVGNVNIKGTLSFYFHAGH